jgi:hypothetical protein
MSRIKATALPSVHILFVQIGPQRHTQEQARRVAEATEKVFVGWSVGFWRGRFITGAKGGGRERRAREPLYKLTTAWYKLAETGRANWLKRDSAVWLGCPYYASCF